MREQHMSPEEKRLHAAYLAQLDAPSPTLTPPPALQLAPTQVGGVGRARGMYNPQPPSPVFSDASFSGSDSRGPPSPFGQSGRNMLH
jgi:hypothetical protein